MSESLFDSLMERKPWIRARKPGVAWLFLILPCLLVQYGCSAMKVNLGMRVDLTETPVASIEASLPKGPGNVNQEGVVSLAKDPRVSDKKVGHVTVTVPSHPGLRTDLDIPFRYDMAYTSDFSGKPGMDGTSGLDGRNGFDGQASRGGSITITYDRSKPFLNIIHLSSRNGPPPVFREAAVAALW